MRFHCAKRRASSWSNLRRLARPVSGSVSASAMYESSCRRCAWSSSLAEARSCCNCRLASRSCAAAASAAVTVNC